MGAHSYSEPLPRHILYGVPLVCFGALLLLSSGAKYGPEAKSIATKGPRTAVSSPNACTKGDFACSLESDYPQVKWSYKTLKGQPRVVVSIAAAPEFMMVVLPPREDTVMSGALARSGMYDVHVTALLYKILGASGENCRRAPQEKHAPVVVDVGAGLGLYSMVAASLGCRVLAFEVQPQLVTAIEASLALNEFGAHAEVVNMAVTDEHTRFVVPRESSGDTTALTLTGRDEEEPDREVEARRGNVVVESTRLDHVGVDGDVLVLKIDVGGDEERVVQSARRLLEEGRVHNLVVDFQAHKDEDQSDGRGWTEILESVYAQGFHGRVVTRMGNAGVDPAAPAARLVLSRDLTRDDFAGFVDALARRQGHELLDASARTHGSATVWFYKVRDTGRHQGDFMSTYNPHN